jgi:hypothetical protein
MQKIFNNILMPAAQNRKTDEAIEKVIEFANQMECHLHLLFIIKPSFFSLFSKQKIEAEKRMKIFKLKEKCSEGLIKGLKLFISFQEGDADRIVSKYCETNAIDMILVCGELKRYSFFTDDINSGKLAGNIKCPVLTIKSYPDVRIFKSIVLPIGDFLPVNQIRIAIYLATHFNASIHLVGLEKNGRVSENVEYLKKAFGVLKNNTDLLVVCNTISGKNLANIAAQYAKSVNAGLIMRKPEPKSVLPGLINRLFSRFVVNESKVPVITVS